LVLRARPDRDEESRPASMGTDPPPVRAGTFSSFTELRRIARMQAPHLVGTAIGFEQPTRDGTGVRVRLPFDHCKIDTLEISTCKCLVERLLNNLSLRKDEEPGGGFVQRVNRERSLVGARKVFVNGGPCRRSPSLSRCHREKSRGLVDYEKMAVFVDELDGVSRRGRRHLGPERHVSAFR